MKIAIVDLGSNTIRLSVYHTLPDGRFELLFSEKEMAGLVSYVRGGRLSPEGIQRAFDAGEQVGIHFPKEQRLFRFLGVDQFIIAGTQEQIGIHPRKVGKIHFPVDDKRIVVAGIDIVLVKH